MLTDIAPTYSNVPSQSSPSLPGINTTYADNQPSPTYTTSQSVWDEVKQFGSDFGEGLSDAVKSGYDTVAGGINTVVQDAAGGIARATTTLAKPVEDVTSFGVTQIILVVAVIGAAVYFMGKSGGLRVNAVV